MSTIFEIGIIVFLVLLNGWFAMSELAIISANKAKLAARAADGSKGAKAALDLSEHPGRFLSSVQIGITLVGVLAGAYSGATLAEDLGRWIATFPPVADISEGLAITVVVGAITYGTLIVGELVPKQLALANPETVAATVARAMILMARVTSPLVWLLDRSSRVALMVLGATRVERQKITEEEIKALIMESGGTVVERAMLKGVLDLGDVWVSEVMTHRKDMLAIDIDATPDEIVDQVASSPYTRIPLWRGSPDEIVGVVHAKDLLRVVRFKGGQVTRQDIAALAAKPWFVPEATTLFDQLQAFRRRHEHIALVVDEYGSLLGLVTLEDILEDIVGDIADEHDVPVPGVRPAADGSYTVHGSVTVRDLNRKFDWNLPDEPASTVAGLVMHEARRIPEEGQAFLFHGFRFEILRRERHQITLVRVAPPKPEEGKPSG
jgi:putative hemolysin